MNQENTSSHANTTEESVHDLPVNQELHSALEEHPEPTQSSLADFEQFLQALRGREDPEQKLQLAIQFMQERLAQSGVPHFKEFWDARRLCLDLFKENINPSSRVALWARYSELCRQCRKLKEIFDEQSAFAAEQIEIAVAAIENEVQQLASLLENTPQVVFDIEVSSLEDHMPEYRQMQRELNLLNAYAMKTSALRKELIKTAMRIRQKNKFFERLSKLGDGIFPRRKELIQQISQLFSSDVERFIKTTFVSELKMPQLFSVRDEIKALQSMAKALTLNTEAFSQTRKTLSECWDSIKNVVKERRKVVSEQKSTFKKHRDEFIAELDTLKKSVDSKELAVAALEAKLEDLVARMRTTQLGKLEIQELRGLVRELRAALSAQTQSEDSVRRQDAMKKEQEKRARYTSLRNAFQELLSQGTNLELEAVEQAVEPLIKELATLTLARLEKQEFDKLVKSIRDLMAEKKEQKLLALTDGDREAIGKLKDLLKERKSHRQEIKAQLETWRKESGSSGLDFTQAMQYNDMIANEKERLVRVEAGIEEIEDKIAKLQRAS